jgi:hypothetical protein
MNEMIFEFPAAAIDQANAFAAEVKTNFGLDGEVLVGLDAQERVYCP